MCMFWPSSHCPDVSNGGQWDHEGIVFLEAASLEKCREAGGGCWWRWGLEAAPPSSPPVVLELGLISDVTDPYKASLFWPWSTRMALSVVLIWQSRTSIVGLAACCRDTQEPESEREALLSTVLSCWGGPGKHHASSSQWSKSALQRRGVTQKPFFWSCRYTGLSLPLSDANLKQKLTGLHVCKGHREEPSPTLPGGIIQGMPNPSWERGRRDIASGESKSGS